MKKSSMGWDTERLTELTLKYITGELTVEEQAELEQWLNADPVNRQRFEARVSEEGISAGLAVWQAATESKERVRERMVWRKTRVIWRRVAVAAAVLVVLSVGGLMMLSRTRKINDAKMAVTPGDLPPGGNHAVLMLSSGLSVVLDSSAEGLVARQGKSAVVKTGKGQLTYEETPGAAETGFNTISTPRGGEYEVRLPDGTKVWLNAASSVRFPTAFDGKQREVELNGEAYFEVVHRDDQPFVVKTHNAMIRDVGTHFDVNAYSDEPDFKTTVLEGAVQVDHTPLKQGQQIRYGRDGDEEVIKDPNLEEAIAWKNGLFEFNGADIETVMRAIGRWYDVTISYQAEKDSHRFTGQISRSANASEAIQILATSGYHFNIQGKVITVLP